MNNVQSPLNANQASQENPILPEPGIGDTIQRVFWRTLTSPLFWTASSTAIGFTAIALGAYSIGGSAFVCAALFFLIFKGPICSEGSLIFNSIYNYFKNYSWWTQITQHLYVGALPLNNFGHLEQLRALGITSVVSINQEFEVRLQGPYQEPVTPEQWEAAGINFRQFNVEDYGAVSPDTLRAAVDHITMEIAQERRVYLHCLVGRGRSVSVAEAYVFRYGYARNEAEAYEYIRQRRPQASPNPAQRAAVNAYIQA